ncbi:MAG: hypothetical protein AAFU67_12315 [Bacteroidota bacterium]
MHQKLFFFIFLLLLGATGCSVGTYGEAQRAFSAGARLANAELMGIDLASVGGDLENLYGEELPNTTTGNARTQFGIAKEKLQKILTRPKKLEKVNLLGNTHVLLALTELQLANYPAAIEQAKLAQNVFAATPNEISNEGGRDRAMALAIEPMVTSNQVFDSVQLLLVLPPVYQEDSTKVSLILEDFIDRRLEKDSRESLTGVLNELDYAIAKATNSSATIRYLRSTQMAVLTNYRALVDRWMVVGQQSGTFRRSEMRTNAFTQSLEQLDQKAEIYRLKLLAISPDGDADPAYLFWRGKAY